MGLGARIEAMQATRKQNGCGVAKLATSMNKKDREEFLGFVRSSVYASILADACEAEGYKISAHTINRHRKGQCLCEKEAE